MYGRNKRFPLHQPLCVIIVLVICACSVSVHFVTEDLMTFKVGVLGFDLDGHAQHNRLILDHCEDNFIFPFLSSLSVVHTITHLPSPLAIGAFIYSFSPLHPPPNP